VRLLFLVRSFDACTVFAAAGLQGKRTAFLCVHADDISPTVPVTACFACASWQQRCYLCPALDSITGHSSLETLIFLQSYSRFAKAGQQTMLWGCTESLALSTAGAPEAAACTDCML
jgi:hypothetical protein